MSSAPNDNNAERFWQSASDPAETMLEHALEHAATESLGHLTPLVYAWASYLDLELKELAFPKKRKPQMKHDEPTVKPRSSIEKYYRKQP